MVFTKNTENSIVERVTNDEVLRRAGVQRELLQNIWKRQMSFVDHVYRQDDLENTALTGRGQGKSDHGRQGLTYLQSINNWATNGLMRKTEFLRTAERRVDWRLMTADVCNRPGT